MKDVNLPLNKTRARIQRGRSCVLAVFLFIIVGLIYAVTVLKLGANILERPL